MVKFGSDDVPLQQKGYLNLTVRRIGILGGSFDPVHIGHIQVALGIAAHCHFDEVRLVPCAQHALGKAAGADPVQRSVMLKLAMAGPQLENITLDTRELERKGISYSVTSCEEIRKEEGSNAVLGFIIGTDLLPSLHRWHDWQSLLSYVNLIVVERAIASIASSEVNSPVNSNNEVHSIARKGGKADKSCFEPIRAVPEVQALLGKAVSTLTKPCGDLIRVQLPPYPVSSTNIRKYLAQLHNEIQACQLQDASLEDLNSLVETGKMGPDATKAMRQLQLCIDHKVLSYIVENRLYTPCVPGS